MSIKVTGLEKYLESKGSKICLGTFDGFHQGHQKLAAKAEFMVTFEPHPKEILLNTRIPRLTTPEEQRYFFQNQMIINFNKTISKMTAIDFLNNIIKKMLNPSTIIVGYDFKFGANGQGNIKLLDEWGKSNNCEIITIKKQTYSDKEAFKSSMIRAKIQTDPELAIKLLGHPYLMIGTVIDGEKKGREIGFPTANLQVGKTKCIPKFGVYKSYVKLNNKRFPSISYIGRKPSFNGNQPSIETHILDQFNKDIYGEKLYLFLESFIREEKKFTNINKLIEQIKQDINICY